MNFIYFILLSVFWGTAYVGVKYNVNSLDPFFSAFLRTFIGLLFFAVWYGARKKKVFLPLSKAWKPYLAGWLIMGLPFLFLYWGQQFIPAGTGGIFNGTVPLWTFVIAACTVKGVDAFTWRKALGVLTGFCGLLFLFKPALEQFYQNLDASVLYGSLSLLIMAACYAGGNVLTKYILDKDISEEQNIFQQYFFSAVFLLAVFLLSGHQVNWQRLGDIKMLGAILYVGIFSSAVALLLLFKLLKAWGALKASLASYAVPFIAVSTDFLFNGRKPDSYEVAGMLVIIVSLLLIQFDKTAAPKKA